MSRSKTGESLSNNSNTQKFTYDEMFKSLKELELYCHKELARLNQTTIQHKHEFNGFQK